MLSQHSHTFSVVTGGRQFHDLTRELETLVEQAGYTTGLATLHTGKDMDTHRAHGMLRRDMG